MLQIANIDAIRDRAARLGLSLGELAKASGFAASTPYRWTRGVSPNLRTLEVMLLELERRERAALVHLETLHRPPQSEAAE